MKLSQGARKKHNAVKTPERTKTLGHLVVENGQKDHPGIVGVMELVQEANKDYEEKLLSTIEEGKRQREGDFYIVILFKKERLFDEVLRSIFFHRKTCPTPTTSQCVYKYYRDPERLEFLWVVPDKDTCMYYCDNAMEVVEEERDLLNFILDFMSLTLDQKCRELNGETINQPRIILVSPN